MSWTEFKAHRPTGLWLQQDIKSQEYIRHAYKHTNDTGSYILVFLSTLTVFFRSRKKKQCQRTKKAPPLPPPPSQLIFSFRLIKGKLSPRWVLIWAFRVFSLGVFSCDWWKAQTKAKCNSCALDSEHLSNPTIPRDPAIVRERKNKSGRKKSRFMRWKERVEGDVIENFARNETGVRSTSTSKTNQIWYGHKLTLRSSQKRWVSWFDVGREV